MGANRGTDMKKTDRTHLFKDRQVRAHWSEEREKWCSSIVDVIAVLTDSRGAKRYWSVLKTRIAKERGQPTAICSTLKMRAGDGTGRGGVVEKNKRQGPFCPWVF